MNPNLPVGGSAFELESGLQSADPEGVTLFGFSLRLGRYDRELEGSTAVGELTGRSLSSTLSVLAVRHFFGEGLSAELELPVGSVHYVAGVEQPTQVLSGTGDLGLGLRYDLGRLWGAGGYRPSLNLGIGLGLPTGDQAAFGEEGTAFPPNLLSLGVGAFSFNGRLEASQYLHKRVALRAALTLRQPLGPNEKGAVLGRTFGGSLGAAVVPLDRWIVVGQLDALGRAPTYEGGVEEVLNSGGFWLAGELFLGRSLGDRVTVGVGARLPIFTQVNGRQLTEAFSVMSLVSVRFGGSEDDGEDAHDHGDDDGHGHGAESPPAVAPGEAGDGDGHAHGDEHGEASEKEPEVSSDALPNVSDLALGGQSFDESAVGQPGKIVVVDFWADWCAPCKKVDATLHELAAAHPELLVVYRVEVPDFESAVATEHLSGAAGLPVVWIYGRQGDRMRVLQAEGVVDGLHATIMEIIENTGE